MRQCTSELTGEWFSAWRKEGAFYEPIAGEHATFEEALERAIFCGVEPCPTLPSIPGP